MVIKRPSVNSFSASRLSNRIRGLQGHRASWVSKSPNWLRNGILGALPKDWLDNFDEQDQFITDGFAMFSHLLHLLQPTSTDSVIQMVMDLADLMAQQPNEAPSAYLARARRTYTVLKGVKLEEIIPLLTLCRLDCDQFAGLHSRICQGDKSLLTATMQEVEESVKTELSYVKIFDDAVPSGGSQVRRATSNNVPPDTFDPPPLTVRLLKDYVKAHPTMCLGCYQEKPLHFEKGCSTCASAGWFVVKDAEQSK